MPVGHSNHGSKPTSGGDAANGTSDSIPPAQGTTFVTTTTATDAVGLNIVSPVLSVCGNR